MCYNLFLFKCDHKNICIGIWHLCEMDVQFKRYKRNISQSDIISYYLETIVK